jgi:hypothetical protein
MATAILRTFPFICSSPLASSCLFTLSIYYISHMKVSKLNKTNSCLNSAFPSAATMFIFIPLKQNSCVFILCLDWTIQVIHLIQIQFTFVSLGDTEFFIRSSRSVLNETLKDSFHSCWIFCFLPYSDICSLFYKCVYWLLIFTLLKSSTF